MAATGGVYLRQRLAVFSVALGTFTLVTNEFLPVALLTGIRTSLGVSQGAAAAMVTLPAAVAAIASPALTVASGRLDRRLVLLVMGLASRWAWSRASTPRTRSSRPSSPGPTTRGRPWSACCC